MRDIKTYIKEGFFGNVGAGSGIPQESIDELTKLFSDQKFIKNPTSSQRKKVDDIISNTPVGWEYELRWGNVKWTAGIVGDYIIKIRVISVERQNQQFKEYRYAIARPAVKKTPSSFHYSNFYEYTDWSHSFITEGLGSLFKYNGVISPKITLIQI